MDEKQKKQVEIIREVLKFDDNQRARQSLLDARLKLRNCAIMLTKDLSVIDVLSGHSDAVMAASAILGVEQQIEMLLNED